MPEEFRGEEFRGEDFRVLPVGEEAVLVEFPPLISPATNARVHALVGALAARPDVRETVPGFATVLVVLAGGTDRGRFLRDLTAQRPPGAPTDGEGRIVHVPVTYGGAAGPDLPEVARRVGLDPREVIALHSGSAYRVYMLGFAPGFPYLGILPEPLRLPRRPSPRPRVPAGSVGIADVLTGVYPLETAGGWHLIGRTSLRFFDPAADPPVLCAPGDRVQFIPGPREGEPPAGGPEPGEPGGPSRRDMGHPALLVREPGLVATVQDGGRFGYRRIGVPWSGPMDPRHHATANGRAGNPPAAAALEMTWPAPVLEAAADLLCGLSGPGWEAVVDGRPVDAAAPLALRRGAVLEFRRTGRAMWAYLAVGGGIDVPEVLGSRSTYLRGGFGGIEGRALRAGDVVGRGEVAQRPVSLSLSAAVTDPPPAAAADPLVIRMVPGPHEAHFDEEGLRRVFTDTYTVTPQIDRSGYRLAGPPVPGARAAEILPQGTLPGAVQVPPDGQPIVLMADGPTTGGYPQVGTVVAADLPHLAQAGPGTRVRFRPVHSSPARP